MKNKVEIFCTLGPSSLNKKFLKFATKKIDLLRLNMSHIKLKNLEKIIKKIKNYSKLPICIDTEGSQIRTQIIKAINLKTIMTKFALDIPIEYIHNHIAENIDNKYSKLQKFIL